MKFLNTQKDDKKPAQNQNKKLKGKGMPKLPRGGLWGNILTTVLILLIIASIYSLISDTTPNIS